MSARQAKGKKSGKTAKQGTRDPEVDAQAPQKQIQIREVTTLPPRPATQRLASILKCLVE